jgi:hypothetical protein
MSFFVVFAYANKHNLKQEWANFFGRGPKKKEKTLDGPM